MAELVRVAIYPVDASESLIATLRAAGFDATPLADTPPSDPEDTTGLGVLVVELRPEQPPALSAVRRARDLLALSVLGVISPEQLPTVAEVPVDDFVVTPVEPDELAARIARLSASTTDPLDEVVSYKDLSLNLATYQASVGGHPVDLTYMEYELLRFFVANQGRVWSRDQLLSRVWGYDYFGGARTVDVHVRRLRAKLGEERASWITTVRSVGYRFG